MYPVIVSALSGAYHGGVARLLEYTKFDKKVFDFVAPKATHALAFGVFSVLASSLGETVIRNMTNTRFERDYGMYARGERMMSSSNPVAYKYGYIAVHILSLFGTAYTLNQMNYRIPYRFVPIAQIPTALLYLYDNS
ncbi:hypothetical protein [Simkania sp.]|uniref:hypothetical protein n=1 Tax=Simkania sp. TaxID=34094 RepID=UPI003B51756B